MFSQNKRRLINFYGYWFWFIRYCECEYLTQPQISQIILQTSRTVQTRAWYMHEHSLILYFKNIEGNNQYTAMYILVLEWKVSWRCILLLREVLSRVVICWTITHFTLFANLATFLFWYSKCNYHISEFIDGLKRAQNNSSYSAKFAKNQCFKRKIASSSLVILQYDKC